MPELRQNPATKEWVIIATERAKRPEDFAEVESREMERVDISPDCPFCPGNEKNTPPEELSYLNDAGEWRLRVVPNKFAALVPVGEAVREQDQGFFRSMNGVGKHEVIIETPSHWKSFGDISDTRAAEIVRAYYERFMVLSSDERFKLVKIFRNCGSRAGTSLEHPHSQIVATPVVPLHIRHRIEAAIRYYDDHGICVFCKMIEMEMAEKDRIIMEEDGYLAFSPFASRTPFETWVLPKKHMATFGETSMTGLKSFGRMLNRIIGRINERLDYPAYNMVIRTAPSGEEGEEYYHWHAQIIPRLTTPAGFELGTGVYINTSLPEDTAAFLRETSD